MMFEAVKPAPADTILGLTEAYEQDQNPKKINLGAGVYKDEQGNTPILKCVRAAERLMLEEETTKTYLPIGGSPAYARLVQELIFGEQHPVIASGYAKTVHTPGGTAALRVGADFLHQALPKARIWVSDPTWANHRGVFEAAGFPVHTYTYYDAAEKALNFERMCSDLERIPGDDVVLLHVCCHNPTGVDPSHEQWQEIATIARRRRWMPLLDFAYQGFGSGLEQDRAPLALFLADGAELVVASSFSKNFGLYQERAGALTLVSTAPDVAEAVLSQVKRIIRVNYSNPPAHGGHVVETVLRDAPLRKQWESEVTQMRERIKAMRTALVEGLHKRKVAGDFSFVSRQNGMFSYSGLTDTQVKFLREQKSVYMVTGGRMNVAGITTSNITYLCDAIAEALSL
jgi:aspartate/tyrosine/aromatic aminotransferase